MKEFDNFRDQIGKRVVILGHHNADPDVIGAAQGVKELVYHLNENADVEIVLPNDVSSLSVNMSSMLEISIHENSSIVEPDTIIIVDTGGLNQLGEWAKVIEDSKAKIVFIDHHLPDSEVARVSSLYIVESGATSASEIVYRLMKHHEFTPSVNAAKALLSGIAFDTRHFSMGGAETFRLIAELLDQTGDISEIKDLLRLPSSVSERIARLKAGQRLEFISSDDWVIVFSRLGSFQSSGARALIGLGADIVLVAGEEKGVIRASIRSTNRFYKETQIHLGELASSLGSFFDGSGSGHPTAAGVNAKGSIDDFLEKATELIRQ
ncbi:MAG: DHH family phosphoesterase [Candidatus Bathyarchaeota archaeon]|nr:DHH family phosphoesterase [Candidatus Bathyarchaeota archaeon]